MRCLDTARYGFVVLWIGGVIVTSGCGAVGGEASMARGLLSSPIATFASRCSPSRENVDEHADFDPGSPGDRRGSRLACPPAG